MPGSILREVDVCHYLPDRKATLEYELKYNLSGKEYERRLNSGYRKFGAILFRPVCGSCRECRPIRISPDRFRMNRSQKRALARNRDLQVTIGVPAVDSERLQLYNRYHRARAQDRGWAEREMSEDMYVLSYLQNPIEGLEIALRDREALRAIVLLDVTPTVLSAVYHYYDPDWKSRSLGTFALLQVFEAARLLEKSWVHLGYFVAGCQSMEYKGRFEPAEILDAGVWRPFTA